MSEDAAHDSLGPSGGHDNVGEVVRLSCKFRPLLARRLELGSQVDR